MDQIVLLLATSANAVIAIYSWRIGELRAATAMGFVAVIGAVLLIGGFHP